MNKHVSMQFFYPCNNGEVGGQGVQVLVCRPPQFSGELRRGRGCERAEQCETQPLNIIVSSENLQISDTIPLNLTDSANFTLKPKCPALMLQYYFCINSINSPQSQMHLTFFHSIYCRLEFLFIFLNSILEVKSTFMQQGPTKT